MCQTAFISLQLHCKPAGTETGLVKDTLRGNKLHIFYMVSQIRLQLNSHLRLKFYNYFPRHFYISGIKFLYSCQHFHISEITFTFPATIDDIPRSEGSLTCMHTKYLYLIYFISSTTSCVVGKWAQSLLYEFLRFVISVKFNKKKIINFTFNMIMIMLKYG